jgi:hypothetical protein
MREIMQRTERCVMCNEPVMFDTVTSPTAGAPEMLRVHYGPGDRNRATWYGLVRNEDSGKTLIAICCSDKCVQALLTE